MHTNDSCIALTMEKMQIKSTPRLQAWVTNIDYQHCWERQGNQPLSHHQSQRTPGSTKTTSSKLTYHIPGIRRASYRSSSRKPCQQPSGMSCLNYSLSALCITMQFKKNKNQRTGKHFMCRQMNKQQSTIICLAKR